MYVMSTTDLYESHMASYGLTDIEDVGILIQNNQKTINGLQRESTWRLRDKREERGRERGEGGGGRGRENRESFVPLPFVQGSDHLLTLAHNQCYSVEMLYAQKSQYTTIVSKIKVFHCPHPWGCNMQETHTSLWYNTHKPTGTLQWCKHFSSLQGYMYTQHFYIAIGTCTLYTYHLWHNDT